MRVICINSNGWWDALGAPFPGPLYEEICFVEDAIIIGDHMGYWLRGYISLNPAGERAAYISTAFRELTDEEKHQEVLIEQAKRIINRPMYV